MRRARCDGMCACTRRGGGRQDDNGGRRRTTMGAGVRNVVAAAGYALPMRSQWLFIPPILARVLVTNRWRRWQGAARRRRECEGVSAPHSLSHLWRIRPGTKYRATVLAEGKVPLGPSKRFSSFPLRYARRTLDAHGPTHACFSTLPTCECFPNFPSLSHTTSLFFAHHPPLLLHHHHPPSVARPVACARARPHRYHRLVCCPPNPATPRFAARHVASPSIAHAGRRRAPLLLAPASRLRIHSTAIAGARPIVTAARAIVTHAPLRSCGRPRIWRRPQIPGRPRHWPTHMPRFPPHPPSALQRGPAPSASLSPDLSTRHRLAFAPSTRGHHQARLPVASDRIASRADHL